MKIFFSVVLLLIFGTTFGQKKRKTETPFLTIHRILDNYLTNPEATDSQENKDSMMKALKTLQHSGVEDELYLLINVWLYYDPTDFPTRVLINPIFFTNKRETIYQIGIRIENQRKGEKEDTAPFSDLFLLKDTLSKSSEN